MKVSPREYIGGDFSIDPATLVPAKLRNTWFGPADPRPAKTFSTGRSAMVAAIQEMNVGKSAVLLPEYLCEAQILELNKVGIEHHFYQLNADLTPDFNSLQEQRSKASTVLIIDYFGLLNLDALGRSIKDTFPEFVLIADCVQAPLHLPSLDIFAAAYISLRKFLPIPDGAGVFSKKHVRQAQAASAENKFLELKTQAAILKYHYLSQSRINVEIEAQYLRQFAEGEEALDHGDSDARMSDRSIIILDHFDRRVISQKRRENYQTLATTLGELQIEVKPIADGVTPFCLPLRISQRDLFRKAMMEGGVFCPIHWPTFPGLPENSVGRRLAKEEIGLVIDQRYGPDDMERQAGLIRNFMSKNPSIAIKALI